MERKIRRMVRGYPTQDGAGVKLIRVLGNETVHDFSPFLMLDSFDSTQPTDYTAGFPLHPHRGIETISYVAKGKMQHKDTLGFEDTVGDGEVQWMTAGSGIEHEENIPPAERLLGIQLWMNLPKKDKMCPPAYHAIKHKDIEEIPVAEGQGTLRLLAGTYLDHTGLQGEYLPLDYYELILKSGASISLPSDPQKTAMVFTLSGDAEVAGTSVREKTAAALSEGDTVTIQAPAEGPEIRVLYMSAPALDEPVAWGGPIVMNTREELHEAFNELRNGTFIKELSK
ncbi:MAG: pirin family protein [Catenisphaera adipataccumulans]|uniref:pirin family protein n=1 Tax=Catenisphaera adipataccumulans TaxID=700500 RepID=UPI003D8D0FB5